MRDLMNLRRHVRAVGIPLAVAAALPTMADAATFVIDGSGSGIVATTTGVTNSIYNSATIQSTASSFTQTFSNQSSLEFDIIWRNPAVPYMTGISTSDVLFKDAGKTVGFLRYTVNNLATAYVYHVSGAFYDAELTGSYPTPQGTSITTVAAGADFVIPNIAFLDMTVTVRTAGSPVVPTTAVPEASTWAMMIIGFAGIGGALRRRSDSTVHSAT